MRSIFTLCLALSSAFAVVDEMGSVGSGAGAPAAPSANPILPDLNWQIRQSMPTARYGMAVAATGGWLYAVGGIVACD
jgi:hypothetical protein